MSYYLIVLFIHIVGALGFFVALGVEWMSVHQLRRATIADHVITWVRVATGVRRVGMVSMLTLLISGFSMMAIAQVGGAWVIVAFWSLVLLSILAVTLSFGRMTAIARAVGAETGPLSATLLDQLHHPLLWIGIQTRVAIALGIVFLMTVKPALSGSLLTVGTAVVLGLVSALTIDTRRRAQQEPAS